MGKIRFIKPIFFLYLVLFAWSSFSENYLCYVPGAGGLGPYIPDDVTPMLVKKGVPMVNFPLQEKGLVKERANELIGYFEQLIAQDPNAKCHIIAFSMGGLVIRYAANHLSFTNAQGEEEALSKRLLSIATISSPHYGTPLAMFLKKNYPGMKPGLEELNEVNLKVFNDPDSPDYSPVIDGIPFYSYRTSVDSHEKVGSILGKIGHQYITHYLQAKHLDPSNDGIVPTQSMTFGTLCADLSTSHDFMSYDSDSNTKALDFLLAHWEFLNGMPLSSKQLFTKVYIDEIPQDPNEKGMIAKR